MIDITALIARVQQTQHGFTDIRRAADEIYQSYPCIEALPIAHELFKSSVHQARMLAVFMLGDCAAPSPQTLVFLREVVSQDADWRVQEILAQAFDRFCADMGYEEALPTIRDWLQDDRANVRRAVSEGLRIWTSRPYFRSYPEVAVKLLNPLHADESEYVRKSIGNALRDISREHPDLIRAAVATWNTDDKRVKFTYKLASKFLVEK
jgi:3-methyladenine DNA glycosylase AlkC